MPNVPPGLPIAPGIVQDPNKYPQYGAGGGQPGSAAGWKVVTAHNASEKQQFMSQGFLVWFDSEQAAKDFISSESSTFGSGSLPNPLSGLEAIAKIMGDIGRALTDGKMWRSLGWLLLGILLMMAGVALWIGPSAARRSPLGVLRDVGRQLG